MASLVLTAATQGGTTAITPTDQSGTITCTLPSTGGTLQTSGAGFTTNGVAYASSTSALTTGSALVFDGTNLGLGVTPSAWTPYTALQVGNGSVANYSPSGDFNLLSNAYFQSSNFRYITSSIKSSRIQIANGAFGFQISTDGTQTAGSAISYTQAMTLDNSGNLLVGTTSAADSTVRTQSGSSSKDGRIQGWLSTSNGGGHGVLQLGSANTGTGTECSIQLVSGATALGNSPTSANGTQYVWGMGLGPYGVGGNVFAICNDSYTVNVKLNYNSSSWISVSDERIKNITANIENANQIIANWRTVYYTLKSDETNSVKIGLIAQDVQKTLPEVVDVPTREYDDNNNLIPLGVHYSEVVPVLVKAIQEQQSTIQSLTERITALEGART